MERNKIFYLYKVVEEVLELSKDEVIIYYILREMNLENLKVSIVVTCW